MPHLLHLIFAAFRLFYCYKISLSKLELNLYRDFMLRSVIAIPLCGRGLSAVQLWKAGNLTDLHLRFFGRPTCMGLFQNDHASRCHSESVILSGAKNLCSLWEGSFSVGVLRTVIPPSRVSFRMTIKKILSAFQLPSLLK